MAMTEQEKQEIIDGLLEEIRANGLDYSGQTITFPNAFNVTQTERQNVKIPAIDERSATPVHGNVDLEALLTAYGVTHVEEIASDIASNYMKKTADSNLNMNGKNISNINMLISASPVGTSSNTLLMPHIGNANLGLDASASFEEFFTAYVKFIYDNHVGKGSVCFTGTVAKTNYGYGDIRGYISTASFNVDGDGMPIIFHITATLGKGEVFYCYRYGAGDSVHLEKYSTFPYGNTTKDNRINAVSLDAVNGYIRYENGLQICWGRKSLSSVEYNQVLGSIYQGTQTNPITFPQPFISNPSVSVDNTGGFGWIGRISTNTTGVTEIMRYAHDGGTYSGNISYIAIGAWK